MTVKASSIPMEVSAKTTLSFCARCAICGSRPGSGLPGGAMLNIEEYLGQRDDVLQVDRPPQHHLDGQRDHAQKQHDEDAVAPGPQLLELLHQPEREVHLALAEPEAPVLARHGGDAGHA